MINLFTGLPGNGKTLYALSFVKEWSERDNRPVFYSGIADLKLPWTEIEPEKWFDCPANSIIVIDECQRVFRPRSSGKEVPEHVARLETHRHQGLDLVLITQHPMLADTAIRRLVGNHKHIVRTFGSQRATIHEWGSVKDNCDKSSGRTDSIKHFWKYDKKAFDYYKSAEVHTVKRSIPMKVYMFFCLPLLIIAAIWYMVGYADKQAHKGEKMKEGVLASSGQAVPVASVSKAGRVSVSYKDALEDAKQYAFENSPRLVGIPSTAPKYDELTKPTVAPVPAGCLQSKTKCSCFTQQATPISMTDEMCKQIVANGFFQEFDASGKNQSRDQPRSVPSRG
ncbi:zonular occludens toxin domain-containing protein [Undibacterium sp.]|uniref:zonular occludens toxin domain-containing protein n=1 Tax=Undibacterium sp. TaxID=1914977 RepID=UPI0026000A3D|nr:zonular occludens toxin domain-containing protein [Undibacterium sp.]